MCGILCAFNDGKNQKEPVNRWIIDTLQDQLERGQNGFGVIFIDDNLKVRVERATEISKSLLDLYLPDNQARMIVMHHRAPTSTDNKLKQTHPIVVNNGSLKYKYLFIHNGVIANSDDVKKAHEALGFEYTTECTELKYENGSKKFNDSESLAIEVARFIEGQTDTLATIGSAAFICLQVNKKTDKLVKVLYGRNASPLNMSATRGKIRLSSEGEGNSIAEDYLYAFSPKDFKIKKRKMKMKKVEAKEYGNYDFDNYYGDCGFKSYEKTGEGKIGNERIESLEKKLNEISEDGTAIAESIMSDFFEKLSDPTDVLMMNEDFELKEATKQILIIFRDAFNRCQQAVLNNAADEIQVRADKEMKITGKKSEAQKQLAFQEGVLL